MNAHRTYLIFGAAAVLFASALAYHVGKTPTQVPLPPVPPPTPLMPSGPATGSVDGTLRLSYAFANSAVFAMAGAKADLVIDVDAISSPGAAAPLDVAILVDTSGSMVGDKIVKARAATREVLTQLRPGDRATLIAYSTDARVLFGLRQVRGGSLDIRGMADSLEAAGGTNIEGGLQAAMTEFRRGSSPDRVRRIILISDGHATVGATDPKVLADLAARAHDQGITVTTMGLGSDYHELSLTNMARRAGGNYYFIDRSEQLPSVLHRELKTLHGLVARNAILDVQLAPGVTLDRLYGYTYTQTRGGVRIPLSAFYGGQNKSLVLALNIADGTRPVSPASFRLRYADLVNDRVVTVPLSGSTLTPLALAEGASFPTPVDRAAALAAVNKEASARVAKVRAAAAYDEAMVHYERGDRARAKADLERVSKDLRHISGELGGVETLDAQADQAAAVAEEAVRIDSKTSAGKRWLKGNRYNSYKLMLGK